MEIEEFKHGHHAEIPSLRISSMVRGLVYQGDHSDHSDRSGSLDSRGSHSQILIRISLILYDHVDIDQFGELLM